MADDAAPAPPTLRVVRGPDAGRVFVLGGTGIRWRIGRHPMWQVHLTDPAVEARHAEVRLAGSTYEIWDTSESERPIRLQGRPLPLGGHAPLAPGDTIEIGETTLVFDTA